MPGGGRGECDVRNRECSVHHYPQREAVLGSRGVNSSGINCLLRCESSALGLDGVWLQGAAVPWGSIAQTARTVQALGFTFFFLQHCVK